jgi:exosortase/archaeosortase family protein
VFFLLTYTLALYWRDLYIVFNEALFSEFASHILVIPFMLLYIVYRLRNTLKANISSNYHSEPILGAIQIKDIIGLILCTLGFFIKMYGSYTFFPLEFNIISLPIFLSGIVILVYNINTFRVLLFPITFLVLLIPPPSTFTQIVGSFLSTVSSQIAYQITKLIGLPVELVFEYGTPMIVLTTITGQYISLAVDLACSGLYSLIGFMIFSIFLAYITRESMQKKALVVSVGFPLIYFLNVFRIAIIVIIAFFFGPTLALNLFHMFGGWILIFVGVIILFSLSEKILHIRLFRNEIITCTHSKSNFGSCMKCGKILEFPQMNLSNYYLIKSVSLLVAIILLINVQVPVFSFSERGAEISSLGSSSDNTIGILPKIDGYTLDFSYRDTEFERISGQDASLMYQYRPENTSKPDIWVGLEIGQTKAILHSWEGCLITWPSFHGKEVQVTQLDLRDCRLNNNPPITARYFAYYWHASLDAQVVLYWYTKANFQTSSGFQEKYVKISVIEYPIEPDYYQKAEEEIYPIAQAIADYWEPANEWTNMALLMAKNGSKIVLLLSSILIAMGGYFVFNLRTQRNRIIDLINRLEDPLERKLLGILTINPGGLTTHDLVQKLDNMQIDVLDETIVYDKLVQAEKAGLARRKIGKINDEPYLNWNLI